MTPFLSQERAERARDDLSRLGGATCPNCNAPVWRVQPPSHYAADHLLLEEYPAGAWLFDGDDFEAIRVGVGKGELRIHICDRKPEDGEE